MIYQITSLILLRANRQLIPWASILRDKQLNDVGNNVVICCTKGPFSILVNMFTSFLQHYINPMYPPYGVAIKKTKLFDIGVGRLFMAVRELMIAAPVFPLSLSAIHLGGIVLPAKLRRGRIGKNQDSLVLG